MGDGEVHFSGNLRFCAKYPRNAALHFSHKSMISQWTTTAPLWITNQSLYPITSRIVFYAYILVGVSARGRK
jgi:hypothetical protein